MESAELPPSEQAGGATLPGSSPPKCPLVEQVRRPAEMNSPETIFRAIQPTCQGDYSNVIYSFKGKLRSLNKFKDIMWCLSTCSIKFVVDHICDNHMIVKEAVRIFYRGLEISQDSQVIAIACSLGLGKAKPLNVEIEVLLAGTRRDSPKCSEDASLQVQVFQRPRALSETEKKLRQRVETTKRRRR